MHLTVPVSDRDTRQGSPISPITLVEYGNYECSRCQVAHFNVQEIQRWLNRYLQFVYRDFAFVCPYSSSEFTAQAAHAAGSQGKFWQMHNYLFENSQKHSLDDLKQAAFQLGLNLHQFEFAIGKRLYTWRIHEDWKSGIDSGVQQTPTFFINGIQYHGSLDLDSLMEAIEQAGLKYELHNLFTLPS